MRQGKGEGDSTECYSKRVTFFIDNVKPSKSNFFAPAEVSFYRHAQDGGKRLGQNCSVVAGIDPTIASKPPPSALYYLSAPLPSENQWIAKKNTTNRRPYDICGNLNHNGILTLSIGLKYIK